jgi:hypothetical protein
LRVEILDLKRTMVHGTCLARRGALEKERVVIRVLGAEIKVEERQDVHVLISRCV